MAAVAVDVLPSMFEPGFGHHNRREGVGHQAGRQPVLAPDIVVAGPIRRHLAVRQGPHRLWHQVPFFGMHAVPRAWIHQQTSIAREHPVEPLTAQRGRHRIPLGQMHVPPERQVRADVVRRRVPRHTLTVNDIDHRDRRGVEPDIQEVG